MIGLKWGDAGFDVINPADGSVLDQAPDSDREMARRAIAAATEAFRSWSQTTPYERAEILVKSHSIMMERKED